MSVLAADVRVYRGHVKVRVRRGHGELWSHVVVMSRSLVECIN